jgi:ribonuclease D
MTSSQIQYIDTTQGVATLAATLSGAPWIAIDTEFLRERTYRPELCLLQIASGGSDKTVACIDPLAVDNIDPLLDVIYEPSVLKVLHAAGQDLEIFYWLRGEVPHNLFDTQVAAPLLGYAEQIGYGNLVSEILKKELSKSHSRADWSRRPLPAKQLQYAADDVIYLSQMYPVMRDRLNKLGRLSWLDQEWLDMTRSEIYEKPAGEVWKRLRHIEKLKGPRLSIAQQLASWRELTARKENLPRNWLMKDETISDLAKQMPDELGELKHVRGLSSGTIKHHGQTIVDTIEKAKEIAPEKLQIPKRKSKLTPAQDAALDALTAVARLYANDLQINASILAPRKSLEDLLRGDRDTTVTQGWRGKLVGSALCDVLDGKSGLTFVDGELTLHSQ